MTEVQKKMDAIEKKALKMGSAEKKVQVILTEVGTKVRCLKKVLKQSDEKLMAAEAKVAKAEAKVVKSTQKAIEDFRALEEFMDRPSSS
ncbi:hypothetical protein COCNU_04G000200 [Cocos nucifera]|uniref:Uncharacterized protein n=1 Tax=Cocos nucifera TaxID=13894 RepID=A0A8K0N017_COCNU|nr:hypothetical protein COCNU_04G000200 [Cocos nucifera]